MIVAEPQDNSLEVNSPWGKIKTSGSITLLVIIFGAAGIFGWNKLQAHDETSNSHLSKILEAQEATNYILTLSQDDRNKLQLTKPKAVREMERRDNR
jgi:predicted negative regulator of RcsB-dependent stress response